MVLFYVFVYFSLSYSSIDGMTRIYLTSRKSRRTLDGRSRTTGILFDERDVNRDHSSGFSSYIHAKKKLRIQEYSNDCLKFDSTVEDQMNMRYS